MKAALLGTDHYQHDTNPQTILREAGINYLQRMAGYIPNTMPVNPITLPPANGFSQYTTDTIMSNLSGQTVTNCNQRVPLLLLAWLLVGSDNEFRVSSYAAQANIVRDVAFMLLRCAMGEHLILSTYYHVISGHLLRIEQESASNTWHIWADETIAWIFEALGNKNHAVKAVESVVWSATRFAIIHANMLIQKQVQEWCHIDDEDAMLIIQWLLLDALNSENET